MTSSPTTAAYGSQASLAEDLARPDEVIGEEAKPSSTPPSYEETFPSGAGVDDNADDVGDGNGTQPLLQRIVHRPADAFDVEDPEAEPKSLPTLRTRASELRRNLAERYPLYVANILTAVFVFLHLAIAISLFVLGVGLFVFVFIGFGMLIGKMAMLAVWVWNKLGL